MVRNDAIDVSSHFREIYEKNLFQGRESISGPGSSLQQTILIRQQLPKILSDFDVKSLLDAPCGDCHWISDLDWSEVKYTGADVVDALITTNQSRLQSRGMTFLTADLCRDSLPRSDLILCRDCWVHLPLVQAKQCLANFRRSGAAYLLTTTFPEVKRNADLGEIIWRPLNLQLAPFSFPKPLRLLVEGCTEEGAKYADKALGLWRLEDLPT